MLESMYRKREDRRYVVALYVVLIAFAVLIVRLFFLQIVEGSHYRELADGNRIRDMKFQATRGVIIDREGGIIVGSRPVYIVCYTKQERPMSAEEEVRLSRVIGISPETIRKRIQAHGNAFGPVHLATDINQNVVATLEEFRDDFPGITIEVQPLRYYPYEGMAANVLGYVGEAGPDDHDEEGQPYPPGTILGRAGLELYYDNVLRGKDGGRQVEVDATGRPVKDIESRAIVPGHNIRLTLDIPLQLAAEEAIREELSELAEENYWPTGVAAVAMDPNTGAVLAMANWPSYNPNSFARGISDKEWRDLNENSLRPFDNRAISGLYPPGSIFKIVTGIAALENKVVTPEEKIYDEGKHWLIDKRNAGGEAFGWIDFYEAMAKSDNVYFYEMGNRLGIDKIEAQARAMGLGQKTGIDLYGEAEGLVASEKYKEETFGDYWYLGETFDAAIGQSFNLATPIQIAVLMSEIANGGTRYKPYIVSRVDRLDGSPEWIHTPETNGKITISQATLAVIRRSLREVTGPNGTAGLLFKDYPVVVAGKTGTSETGSGADHAWFAAYAPYDKPQIVVVVIVEHAGYGIESAAPIAKKMITQFLHLDKTAKKEEANGKNSNTGVR